MSTLLESSALLKELPGWALRGVLCAASSAFWAVMVGFSAPAEVAGMVAGVACWAGIFAVLSAWTPRIGWLKSLRLGAALKRAASIKIGLVAAAWFCMAVCRFVHARGGAETLELVGFADMFLGAVALRLVARWGSFGELDHVAQLDSFSWTAATTLIEGAMMAALIGLIALAVIGWWRLQSRAALRNPSSPSRYPG